MTRTRANGFTLLEMLVALSILSLAALALVRLDAFALRNAADIERGSLARIVAANEAANLLSAPEPPAAGDRSAMVVNGGVRFRILTRTRAAAAGLLRVDIVAEGGGGRAALTLFRPADGDAR